MKLFYEIQLIGLSNINFKHLVQISLKCKYNINMDTPRSIAKCDTLKQKYWSTFRQLTTTEKN